MMITNLNDTSDYAEKMHRCQDYVDALEEERRKIQVFQRELPLCLELVTQAIEACKQQISNGPTEYHFHGQSECSEQTSSEGPVLEEFIPIKRATSSDDDDDDDDDEQQCKEAKKNDDSNSDVFVDKDCCKNNDNKASKKSDWLRSVQLWNQTSDPTPSKEVAPRKVAVMEVKRNGSGGAFYPFKREKSVGTSSTNAQVQSNGSGGGGASAATAVAPSSSAETGGSSGGGGGNGGSNKEEKEGQSQRKQRRCWSPELHRRFLQALQQLGGSHVATPKQIRELMKVDGLTNDEVKSHLQKYRLHTRRPSTSTYNNATPQAPRFVVVGGIWVPPAEYAAMAATPNASAGEASAAAANSNGIYAPIAKPPPPRTIQEAPMALKHRQQHKQLHADHDHQQGSHDSEGGVHPNSPTTSSSDTTTASPPTC